ncbi:MAG: hypothetical protein HRT45_08525 [Bdellovibrionales bacterium]|nr:hypothetical protein [Bdellovibrionales bacterium]
MGKTVFIFLFAGSIGFSASAEDSLCHSAYKKAVQRCSSYEHSIDSSQLKNVGDATKKRTAEMESMKLFSMGRACAKAQKSCIATCDKQLESDLLGEDVADLIEYTNDCAQGSVAVHRSNLAKQYLGMKRLSESTRDPASSR